MEELQDTTLVVEMEFGNERQEEQTCTKTGCNAKFMSNESGAGKYIRYCAPCLLELQADLDTELGPNSSPRLSIHGEENQTSASSAVIGVASNNEDWFLADDATAAINVLPPVDDINATTPNSAIAAIQLETEQAQAEFPSLAQDDGVLSYPTAEMNMNDILEVLLTMSRTKTRQPGVVVIGIKNALYLYTYSNLYV
jgi:hypothetical protein